MVLKADRDPKPTKTKFRQPGGGRTVKVQEVRYELYSWFVDIRFSLKARLPVNVFRDQAKFLYQEWFSQQTEQIAKENQLKFSRTWIKNWMRDFNVSLRKPNKRYSIPYEDRKERIIEYIKNVWLIRKYFLDTFGVEIPIINGDQMPLHRNESADKKTMTVKNQDTFVKENHTLSRERIHTSIERSIFHPTSEVCFQRKRAPK